MREPAQLRHAVPELRVERDGRGTEPAQPGAHRMRRALVARAKLRLRGQQPEQPPAQMVQLRADEQLLLPGAAPARAGRA